MNLVIGSKDWIFAAAAFFGLLLVLLLVSYRYGGGVSLGLRVLAASLKALGILLLALCLLEPLTSDRRARPGANQFILLADNSQSMKLKDDKGGETRGKQLTNLAGKESPWLVQLGRDFEVRQFAFDSQLRSVPQFDDLAFDGRTSDLGASLQRLLDRYQGQPLAGVMLLSDGSATDAATVDQILSRAAAAGKGVPPIYPVILGDRTAAQDVSLEQVAVTQTNFEDAPVTLTASISTTSLRGKTLIAELLDDADKTLETQTLRADEEGKPLVVRFKVKPEQQGLSFFKVRAYVEGTQGQFKEPETTTEATLANNARLVAVDRGRGPYRVLYVSGRPNWEYKFLNRAIESDKQVELVGYIRIAKREPKFNFLGRLGDPSNPLWRGFQNKDGEQVEQFDQPVIMRLNTENEEELRGGFPKRAEDLFKYHAIILDDVESEFFTQDQMQLLKEFVRTRGGGLLMLGGTETYKNGKYDRTPIGDMLPVYADASSIDLPVDAKFRMALTREGWLEPWVRLQGEEEAERRRLEQMSDFKVLNPVRGIKPGATILARAQIEGTDGTVPALVEQRFGTGRVGSLLIGDLWRWDLRRPSNTESDLGKAWRQTIRWLVSEVPQRVALTTEPAQQADDGAMRLTVQARDEAFAPLDNAGVSIKVTGPDGKPIELRAEPSAGHPGRYEALFVPRLPGAYRVTAVATAPDGSMVGESSTGWASDPAAEEFRVLQPNRPLMEKVAKSTGGEVIAINKLDNFVKELPTREAAVMDEHQYPFWHQSWVFLLAIALLAGEWGLRRWKGLP